MATNSPDTTSSDYDAMAPYWAMVATILEGADAMRAAGQLYLPQFPNEANPDYEYRRANAKFTNIYADIVANLAAKPFAEEVTLDDKAPQRLKDLAEDIDGRGNNLHKFAGEIFFGGINDAIDWILVEFSRAKPRADGRPLTLEDERKQGLRPYWVHIPATRMLAVYSAVVDGKEIFTHARIRETETRRDGFGEVTVERVRVLNREPIVDESGNVVAYAPATFELWQKTTGRRGKAAWQIVDGGPISIGVIALVPFITGRRKGASWQFIPPMRDAANLQIEHYQQETALKSIKELTAFPMLAANGVQPDVDADQQPKPVPVGPKSVLYAPPFNSEASSHGEWTFIEPTAASLKFLAEDVKNTEQQLRELGRQPLTAQTGNLTVVTTAFAAQKGNSAVQAWALNLKDALEQAFVLTSMWLNERYEPTVTVFTDFSLEMGDDKGPTTLTEARKNGDLSRETYWAELKRRSILSGDFDAKAEEQRLIEEMPDPDDDEEIEGALTPPANDPELAA